MIMSKTEQLDNLFDEWRRKQADEWQQWNEGKKDKSSYLKRYREHENLKKINPAKSFTPDGIIDEEAWNNGEKILFILKEANGQWMLDENLEDNIVEIDNGEFWFRKIVKDNINHNIKRKLNKLSAEKFGESELKAVAYMNINKRGGAKSELVGVLKSYIKEYKEYIKTEIEIISPEIICICCGKNKAYVNTLEEIIQELECKPKVEKYYHPAARIKWEKYKEGIDNI